jgi:hypothetical protein
VKCSTAATRRPSTSVFVFFRVFFRLSFRAFVAMIPHSISHPFLDLKSLTIPHSCEVQKLKTYIKKKPHLCGGLLQSSIAFFLEKKLSRIYLLCVRSVVLMMMIMMMMMMGNISSSLQQHQQIPSLKELLKKRF